MSSRRFTNPSHSLLVLFFKSNAAIESISIIHYFIDDIAPAVEQSVGAFASHAERKQLNAKSDSFHQLCIFYSIWHVNGENYVNGNVLIWIKELITVFTAWSTRWLFLHDVRNQKETVIIFSSIGFTVLFVDACVFARLIFEFPVYFVVTILKHVFLWLKSVIKKEKSVKYYTFFTQEV